LWNDGTIAFNTATAPAVNGYSNRAVFGTTASYNQQYYTSPPYAPFTRLIDYVSANTNSAYNTAFILPPADQAGASNQKSFRLVSAGVRAQYAGPLLNRSGVMYAYRQPQNNPIPNGYASADFAMNEETLIRPVDGNPIAVTWRPQNQLDQGYQDPLIDISTATVRNDNRCMIIYIAGAPVGSQFHGRFEARYEMLGTNLTSSPSHADVQANGNILSSMPAQQPWNLPEAAVRLVQKAGQGLQRAVVEGVIRSYADTQRTRGFAQAQLV